MKKICIIGGSGHAKVVADIIESVIRTGCEACIEGFLDDDERKNSLLGYPRIGKISMVSELAKDSMFSFIFGIGDNAARQRISACYELNWFTAIHPSAIISKFSNIGSGTVIMAGAVINTDVIIGNHVIINTGAIVEHECQVGNCVHISPNATLCGNVVIGDCSHVGAGSVVIQNKRVGSGATIGAGAVVVSDIPDNVVVKGVPAR